MTTRVWLFRIEFDARDWRVGVAWFTDENGFNLYVGFPGGRVHGIRSAVREIAPSAHKNVLPPEPRVPKPIAVSSVAWRKR